LERKVRDMEQDRLKLGTTVKRMETEYKENVQHWRASIEEKNGELSRLKQLVGKDGGYQLEMEKLRVELERRGGEVEKQRQEMAGLVQKWASEVATIREEHAKEKEELEEVTEKYRQLKQKVRRYQRHVEAKEIHYKEEYARLEADYRGTLEKLKGRMEEAYSVKERQVEMELGTMRDHFSEELKKISYREGGGGRETTKTPTELGLGSVQTEVGEFVEALEKKTEEKIRTEVARQRMELLKHFSTTRSDGTVSKMNGQMEDGKELKQFFSKAAKDLQELLQRPSMTTEKLRIYD